LRKLNHISDIRYCWQYARKPWEWGWVQLFYINCDYYPFSNCASGIT